MTLVSNLVCSPLKKSPDIPSLAMISVMTCLQVILVQAVCLEVLTTRIEFETTSDTTVLQNPIPALLPRALSSSSSQLQRVRQCSRQLLVTNQGQCPTIVAKAEATPPWQKAEIPLTLNLAIIFCRPLPPYTCFEVFQASTGRVESRQNPAIIEPREVWMKIGRFLIEGVVAKRVVANMLAAVSPKREMGPMTRAGTMPLQNLTTPPSAQRVLRVGRKEPPFLNWQFMVVRIHIRENTWRAMADAPATPVLAAA